MPFNTLFFGSLLAATGVALGAFGAHGLRHLLSPPALEWWHTAVEYQMWHALGLIGLGATRIPELRWASALLGSGTVLFSGSLYLLALTGLHWLGMVTPLGGLLMISGWLAAAWQMRHVTRQSQ
ncbi:MAG: DUF423 domain-containing protein [Betaproteobacteria bacterium]|nr:DUF423 domain-containing protein [Betaproteobacteria bacterium]